MDEIDEAQTAEWLFRQQALSRHTPVGRPGMPSLARCVECDAEIPERRRQAIPGCRLCLSCQEWHDTISHVS